MNNKKTFIDYYENEMAYLRQSGQVFAQKHPKIAKNLRFDGNLSSDPHVARLLEAFAFWTGRINQRIDQNFAEMGRVLLDILYPQLTRPIPAMSIAQFSLPSHSTDCVFIPRNTKLYTYVGSDETCQFLTAFDLKIWPIDLVSIDMVSATDYPIKDIHIDLKSRYLRFSFNTKKLKIDEIMFYIQGSQERALQIHEFILCQQNKQLLYSQDGKTLKSFSQKITRAVGFLANETTLPSPTYSSHIHTLFQEFFHFPEKFMFFKFWLLQNLQPSEKLEILIPVSQKDEAFAQTIKPNDFSLSSVPIVNLFETTSDPIKIHDTQLEYLLLADQRRQETTEIYDVQNVYSVLENGEKEIYKPFFSLKHDIDEKQVPFWIAKRKESLLTSGSDTYLSFVRPDFEVQNPSKEVVFASIICSNRNLASQMPPQSELYTTKGFGIEKITTVVPPRLSSPFLSNGEALWKLISQLAINHASLMDEQYAEQAVRQIIAIYSRNPNDYQITNVIKRMKVERIYKRFGNNPWQPCSRGISLEIHASFPRNDACFTFLLANLIRYFFTMHISMESFLELILIDANFNNEVMRWEPMEGEYLEM